VPSQTIANNLKISNSLPVWEIQRRRRFNKKPVILETALIPMQLAPTLDEKWLRDGKSLYGMLSTKYGLLDQYEEQFLEVTVPTARERKLLELPTRENVVRVRGVSYTSENVPFDCFEQVYPAQQFVFFVSGSQKKHLLPSHHSGDWTVTHLGKS
jgi:GntR family transcriptional regulator